jgi:hypothetical protein
MEFRQKNQVKTQSVEVPIPRDSIHGTFSTNWMPAGFVEAEDITEGQSDPRKDRANHRISPSAPRRRIITISATH